MLEEAKLDRVRDLAKRSTALPSTATERGSGFFIDDDLILTCAHCVGETGSSVTVHVGAVSVAGKVLESAPGDDADVALVGITDPARLGRPAAVVLDSRLRDDVTYYAYGFPRNAVVAKAGMEERAYLGHERRSEEGEAQLLIFAEGKSSIISGMSGGPVLSSKTGAVVGIVQYRANTYPAGGGGAIPVARAAKLLPKVQEYLSEAPVATRPYRDGLGSEAWVALGRSWGWESRIDLELSGNRKEWTVKAKATGKDTATETYSIRNLPD